MHNFHYIIRRLGRIIYRFGYIVRFLQKFGSCLSYFGSFFHGLIGFLAQYSHILLRYYILLNFNCRGLYRFCCCFEVVLDSYNSLDDGAEIGDVLELGN